MQTVEKPSKWGKVAKVMTVIFTFLLLIASGAFYFTGIPNGASEYRRSREAAQKAGLFFTEEEVDRLRTVAPEDNAISDIAKLKDTPDFSNGEKLPEEIQKHWSKIQVGLAQLRLAAKKKSIVEKWKIDDQMRLDLPWLETMRKWNRILTFLAMQSSERNDFAATREYLQLSRFLVLASDDDHSFVGCARRISGASQLESTLRQIVPQHADSRRWIDMELDIAKSLDETYDFANAVKIQHYQMLTVLNFIADARSWQKYLGESDSGEFAIGSRLPRFKEANLARLHEYYTKMLRALPADPHNTAGIAAAFDAPPAITREPDWSYAFVLRTQIFSGQTIMLESAKRNALLQALTILQGKCDPARGLPLRGRYRNDIDGSSIRVQKLPKGWVVYSVGHDRKDDGGVEDFNSHPDFVVHLSRATVPPKPKAKAKSRGASPGGPSGPGP